jgi:hypothetical protein
MRNSASATSSSERSSRTQLGPGHDQQGGAFHGLGRFHPQPAVEQGDLAEHRRRLVTDQLDNVAVARGDVQLHRALGEEEHAVTGVVLPVDHLATVEDLLAETLGKPLLGRLVEVPKQLGASQDGGLVREVHAAVDPRHNGFGDPGHADRAAIVTRAATVQAMATNTRLEAPAAAS